MNFNVLFLGDTKMRPLFCQDILIFIIRERLASEFPVTAEAICYFDNHPKCPLTEQQYNWTLDLSIYGLKPLPETPQLPPVSNFSFP